MLETAAGVLVTRQEPARGVQPFGFRAKKMTDLRMILSILARLPEGTLPAVYILGSFSFEATDFLNLSLCLRVSFPPTAERILLPSSKLTYLWTISIFDR